MFLSVLGFMGNGVLHGDVTQGESGFILKGAGRRGEIRSGGSHGWQRECGGHRKEKKVRRRDECDDTP